MKTLISLIISFLLLLNAGFAQELPEKSKLISHKIEAAYWYAKGGKIKLKQGSWRFAAREKDIDTEAGKVKDADFTCPCVFTIVNHSTRTYKVTPFISLIDHDRAKLYAASFKPRLLKPREGYVFEDEFAVTRDIVLKTVKLKLELTLQEIEE